MKRFCAILIFLAGSFCALAGRQSTRPFEKVNDGVKLASPVIQAAIDECAAKGGGTVVIPAGNYLCGPIIMRSNVELHLCAGAAIKGKTDFKNDYNITGADSNPVFKGEQWAPANERALIFAKDVENVTISGRGTIDGQSNLVDFKAMGYKDNDGRPYAVLFKRCKNVSVTDVTICNSGFWTLRLWECEKVIIDRVRINSMHFRNNDGIDIDAKDVTISNCIIDAEDDGICLKSDNRDFLPENISITNCIISSNCNPIKFGTSSKAGWKNVTISNCVIRPTTVSYFRSFSGWYENVKKGYLGGMSGVAIECVDGGRIENISVSNITMSGVLTPIFIVLNRRSGIGNIDGINISNIVAEAEGVLPCMVVGLPEKKVQNVHLSNIVIKQRGGMPAMTTPVKEAPTAYPENRMFGHVLPACGLYLRHVDGITVESMEVRLIEQDHRPCVWLDDVVGENFNNFKCFGSDAAFSNR